MPGEEQSGGGWERSKAEGEEKETLSYIGPISAVSVSGISLNRLP